MRVWDVHPGYLSRQSLLGEHREIHAIFSVVMNRKAGYARHPETLRWKDALGSLTHRHGFVVQEMVLRGYGHFSPAPDAGQTPWPETFIDEPFTQFSLLSAKYGGLRAGRIPIPRDPSSLWAQHKYSVMARDPGAYRAIGKAVASARGEAFFRELARTLAEVLRTRPRKGPLGDALLHMWGYVSGLGPGRPEDDLPGLAREIQERALLHGVRYLVESTALSDLAYWAAMP